VHVDVLTEDVDGVLADGAQVLRRRGDSIGWDILADPEGNEFCAFTL
jgi:3-deoxy-D-manno-octulosonate 8-phosphate phosphatase KdsC-like HAD superfamily phosphatase